MWKFHTVMQNGPGSCDYYYCSIDFARPCEIGFLHANWPSLCEMIVLLLNSRLMNGEASRRTLRWCQVSTWPWPINRNLIFLMKEAFWIFLICRIFQISSLYRILYFPSFSLIFSLAKHVFWDQISKHAWLNLVFLREWRI